MKNFLSLFLLCTLFSLNPQWSFSQNTNQLITRDDGKIDLLGLCDRSAFQQEPFSEWFEANYEAYQLDNELLSKIDQDWEGLTVDVFMGTWCGDSKREVPRFYKVLDALDFPEEKTRLVNVDKTPEAYKQSPGQEEEGKLIHRVPTFIIYQDGEEIGRIVEYPVTSLEMDLVQILKGFPASPNYKVVSQVHEYFEEHGVPEDDQTLLQLARSVYKNACGDKALNTYGYYLMNHGELDRAIAALRMNALFFRDLPNVYDSLGEAYLKNEEPEKALKMYQKVLAMDDQNENAQKQLQLIKAKLGMGESEKN